MTTRRLLVPIALLAMTAALAGCASQAGTVVEDSGPGFLLGLWHGFIFPFAWVGSLFMDDVAVYAVPNNGGWYDFGFLLGLTVWAGGGEAARRRRRWN